MPDRYNNWAETPNHLRHNARPPSERLRFNRLAYISTTRSGGGSLSSPTVGISRQRVVMLTLHRVV